MANKRVLLVCSLLIAIFLTAFAAPAQAKDKIIDKGMFVDYAKINKQNAKLSATDQSRTYKYNGVHWANPNVAYYVDQSSSGLDPSQALSAVQTGFDAWEYEINPFGRLDKSVIDYTYNPAAPTNSGAPVLDGKNTVSWGSTPSNAIAVTYYWYYRSNKQLVEFDMVLGKSLPWSTNSVSNTYDVQNIVAHEAGHTLVLLDLYNHRDSELTMYGYGALGETKKRDLGLGDMLGLEKIYPL